MMSFDMQSETKSPRGGAEEIEMKKFLVFADYPEEFALFCVFESDSKEEAEKEAEAYERKTGRKTEVVSHRN